MKSTIRKTDQFEMPINPMALPEKATYDIYPDFELDQGQIHQGFKKLAHELAQYKQVCIEGFIGVDWTFIMGMLGKAFKEKGVAFDFIPTKPYFKTEREIEPMLAPYLGGDDPVFGKRYPGELSDFFAETDIAKVLTTSDKWIIYGPGAQLFTDDAMLCYIDIPKNEIQYRSRAGNVVNLGMLEPIAAKSQYKRMYFVDWPVLNHHKERLLPKIDIFIDGQFSNDISWCTGETFRSGLNTISQNAFRVRPWFEPGVWGGEWIMNRIEGLNRNVVNYAWSFECIVPENGIVLLNNGVRLECSFDFLMYADASAVLGDAVKIFGTEFPIRFDFLDTFNGQNLSLQCHPTPEFIKSEFSETFTQDETYYMLDAAPDAKVYLGFQDDIDPDQFREALITSAQEGKPMEVEDYVQIHDAKKHDLFLIPHGTVHCSGENGLVLEISSTPYIFTFKMYDWMRLDLDGNPRPLNIDRAMKNLNFDCKGPAVKDDYIAKQVVVANGPDWQLVHLSTHPKHFYEVFRMEFETEYSMENDGEGHVMSLVAGNQVEVYTENRMLKINYAETFIIPASAKRIIFKNTGMGHAKIIRASVKKDLTAI